MDIVTDCQCLIFNVSSTSRAGHVCSDCTRESNQECMASVARHHSTKLLSNLPTSEELLVIDIDDGGSSECIVFVLQPQPQPDAVALEIAIFNFCVDEKQNDEDEEKDNEGEVHRGHHHAQPANGNDDDYFIFVQCDRDQASVSISHQAKAKCCDLDSNSNANQSHRDNLRRVQCDECECQCLRDLTAAGPPLKKSGAEPEQISVIHCHAGKVYVYFVESLNSRNFKFLHCDDECGAAEISKQECGAQTLKNCNIGAFIWYQGILSFMLGVIAIYDYYSSPLRATDSLWESIRNPNRVSSVTAKHKVWQSKDAENSGFRAMHLTRDHKLGDAALRLLVIVCVIDDDVGHAILIKQDTWTVAVAI